MSALKEDHEMCQERLRGTEEALARSQQREEVANATIQEQAEDLDRLQVCMLSISIVKMEMLSIVKGRALLA